MNGRTNAKSGSGSGEGAVIRVIAPDGASITFSRGGVTVKSFSASEGFILSTDSQRRVFYYSIPKRLYGDWTVVSGNSNGTYTMTVSVTEARQYDLDATEIWFVKDGAFAKGATSSYSSSQGYGGITQQSDCVRLQTPSHGTDGARGAGYIRDFIEFNGYWRKLVMRTRERGKYEAGAAPVAGFTAGNGYAPGMVRYAQLRSNDGGGVNKGGNFNNWHVTNLDVSTLNGSYRFVGRVKVFFYNGDYYWNGEIQFTYAYLSAI